jgi:iron uptake system EfeUOB component EfeO/EfeM
MMRFDALARLLSGLALGCTVYASAAAAPAEPLDAAAEQYRPLMTEEIDHALAGARALREALVTEDLEAAQKAWIAARIGWERAEVVIGLRRPSLRDLVQQ